MGLVLDASSVLAWLVKRSDSDEALRANEVFSDIEREEAIVPPLWFLEVSNGLLVAERRKMITQVQASRFLVELRTLPIAEDKMWPSTLQNSVLQFARTYRLTSYDATYVELALRTRSSLATFDRRLAEGGRLAGVRIFGDPA